MKHGEEVSYLMILDPLRVLLKDLYWDPGRVLGYQLKKAA